MEVGWCVLLMAMTLRKQQFSESQLRAGSHRVDASFATTVFHVLEVFERNAVVGLAVA